MGVLPGRLGLLSGLAVSLCSKSGVAIVCTQGTSHQVGSILITYCELFNLEPLPGGSGSEAVSPGVSGLQIMNHKFKFQGANLCINCLVFSTSSSHSPTLDPKQWGKPSGVFFLWC